jgi:hypothetical protein
MALFATTMTIVCTVPTTVPMALFATTMTIVCTVPTTFR